MDSKQINRPAEQIYTIISGADNRQEHDETVTAIEDWLQYYDGNDSPETLAAEFEEYYNAEEN